MAAALGSPGAQSPCRPVSPARDSRYQGERGVKIPNFRDVACSSDALRKRLRSGVLFRSSSPWTASSEDVEVLLEGAGIRLIIDLRSPTEREQAAEIEKAGALLPRLEAGGVRKIEAPLLDVRKKATRLFSSASWRQRGTMIGMKLGLWDEASSKDALWPLVERSGLLGMYVEDIMEDCRANLSTCFEALLKEDCWPVLVHCTGGKDRTGVLVALILASAGFDDEDVLEDYNITEEFLFELYDPSNVVAPTIGHMKPGDMQRAPKDTMRAMLAALKAEHGCVSAYLENALGFDRAKQAALRARLLREVVADGDISRPSRL